MTTGGSQCHGERERESQNTGSEPDHTTSNFFRFLSPTYGHTSINQKWKESDIQYQLIKPLEAFIAGTTDVDSAFRVDSHFAHNFTHLNRDQIESN